MGGGSSGPSSTTTNTSNLPEYARPYFERMMERAEAESNQPYVGYDAQRLAGFAPDVQQGFGITRGVAARGTPEVDQAAGIAGRPVNIEAMSAGAADIGGARHGISGATLAGAQNMYGARQSAAGASQVGAGDIYTSRGMTQRTLDRGGMETEQNRNMAGLAASRGMEAGDYRSNAIQQQAFGRGQAQEYMSPYMEEVVARQKAAAVRDFDEGKGSRDTAAIRAGAFGGYRSAIQEGVAQRGLGERLSDIEATGRQRAFESAQAQFERDRAASMSAQGTTEAQRLAAAQYGLAGAGLGLQGAQAMGQFTAAQQAAGLQGAQAMSQLGLAERQAALQQAGMLGQFAATEQGLGYQGADALARLGMGQQNISLAQQTAQQNAAMQQAQMLGQLGAQRQGLTLQQAQALQQQGGAQQQQQQREFDLAYGDFLRQQEADKQQINFMSNILRGVPVQPTQVRNVYENPNPLAQFGGLGIAGIGLARQ
jgi:hypothetical protein